MKKQSQQAKDIKKKIKLSDSYNRSTNLELDYKDSSKLKNIFLSSKFQEGLKEVFTSILEKNSNHRVRVLNGSPGLGKSTFALLIAQIISKKYPKLASSLFKKSKTLRSQFQEFQKSKKTKLLPVFINGYEGEIEKVFRSKLSKTLSDNDIRLNKKPGNTIDYYKATLDTLKKKGYSGIFVIYDEFGKYLEKGIHNPTDLNIQFFQNFSEFCNRSGETQCHLLLITHLSISQYASQLPMHVQQEWAKVEGRFQESAFYDKNADYYKMISSVFEKNISSTDPKMAQKYKTYISKYLSNFKADAFEDFIDLKDIKPTILNCFPLHPSVLSLLPHLSKRVAQNERTLYTFLTRDENYSLKRFLESKFDNHKSLLMPYDLYQYFQSLIGKDIGVGGTYKVQLIAEEAFKKIKQGDEVSKQIISLIALCSVIKDTHFAPITESFITSCFNQMFQKEEITKSLRSLKNKKVIFYNKNNKQYLLQEGSPVDIEEEISKLKNNTLSSKNLVQILKRYFKTDFIQPKKYNFDHAINRFYRTELISIEELKGLKLKNNIDFYREDGVVFYIVPFSHDELAYAQSAIQSICSPLTVFVLPQQFIECRNDIEELNAVDCLYNNKEILSASSLVKKELDRHKEILISSIHSLLKPLIGYMNLHVNIAYPKSTFLESKKPEFKSISHFKELQRYLGNLFEQEYSKYISFNLEYMNRHSVSGSITLGRKRVIDVLRSNKDDLKENISDHIKGYGPDYVILDTLQRISKIKYDSSSSTYQVSKKSEYYKFLKEYESILSQNMDGISGEKLLTTLISPPYGLRLGVIPIFIALADQCFKQPVSHYFDSAYVKTLDGNHYDLLMRYPKKTIVHYTPISNRQQDFLNELSQIFKSKDTSIHSVIEALIKWRSSVPESTKLSSNLSQVERKILIQIDSSKEPNKLLFNRIPDCFGDEEIDTKTNSKEVLTILNKFEEAKNNIENCYKNLLLKVQEDLIKFLQFVDKQCLGNKSSNISKDNFIREFQVVLSKIHNYPFGVNTNRFIGRIINFDSSNHKQYFLETVADVLTGSSPRYWSDKGYYQFGIALKGIKTEIDLACEVTNPSFRGQSVLAFIDTGNKTKTFVKLGSISDVELSHIETIEQVTKALENFDEIDKRKILLSVLESINKASEVAEELDLKDVQEIEINV